MSFPLQKHLSRGLTGTFLLTSCLAGCATNPSSQHDPGQVAGSTQPSVEQRFEVLNISGAEAAGPAEPAGELTPEEILSNLEQGRRFVESIRQSSSDGEPAVGTTEDAAELQRAGHGLVASGPAAGRPSRWDRAGPSCDVSGHPPAAEGRRRSAGGPTRGAPASASPTLTSLQPNPPTP